MKKLFIFIFSLLCTLEGRAYDPSFSEVIKETYAEYYQKKGDWCDCLATQIQELVERYGRNLSFEELAQEGIDSDYLDAMAIEYCKKYPDAYIAIVWPTLNASHEELVYDILSKECLVAYKKTFVLKGNGPKALVQSIPEKAPHIPFDFHCYFPPGKDPYELRCFVIRAPTYETTVRTKHALRNIVNLHPYCMHINDTHDQTIDIACMLLNNHSLHFLNTHKPHHFENFSFLFDLYINFLKEQEISKRDVCVDGSAILSAYGLRDCALDFDFLCLTKGNFGNIHPLDHHNTSWTSLGLSIEDVIYNPKNFFYLRGYKFTSLPKIRDFKALQGRPKDIQDVSLINYLMSEG